MDLGRIKIKTRKAREHVRQEDITVRKVRRGITREGT